jgi:hypothetical protein
MHTFGKIGAILMFLLKNLLIYQKIFVNLHEILSFTYKYNLTICLNTRFSMFPVK